MEDIYAYSAPELIARLGTQFRQYRQANGLTLSDVANRTGLNIMTIQKFENGQSRDISLTTLIRLMRTIGQMDNLKKLLPPLPEVTYMTPKETPIQRVRHKKQ